MLLAGVLLLAESFGLGSALTLSKTVTSHRLSVVITVMVYLSASALLVSATAMRKMLLGAGPLVTCAVFLAGAATTHYLLAGWVNGVVVAVLLFIALGGFGIAALDLPVRGTYILRLTVSQEGMAFLFDKGPFRKLEWGDIDALFVDGSGLGRKLRMRLRPGVDFRPSSPAAAGSKENEPDDDSAHKLFDAYHFNDGDAVLARIRDRSGGLLTDSW
jgi:hypothetical protein